jgi:hypothetical protein
VIALGFAIGLVAGGLLQLAVWSALVRIGVKERLLRCLNVIGPGDRSATLDQLVEAARAAALRIEPTTHGFNVLSQPRSRFDHLVEVRVLDPARASAATMQLTYDGSYALAFHVVLALVPVFGPLTIMTLTIMIDGHRVVVDGSANVHELTNAHARHLRAGYRGIFAALPDPTRR